jgi:predicted nucleic acid-binding protein
MRVYLDSAPIIYLVEDVVPYASELEGQLSVLGTVQVCSDLTRLECRVKPIRDGEPALLAAFDRYFADVIAEVVPLVPQVIDQATLLRARYAVSTPDALHLAAAIFSGCDLFLTNDHRLARCAEIPVQIV